MNSIKKFYTVKEAENYIFEKNFSRNAPDNYLELCVKSWEHFVNNIENYAGTGEEFIIDLGTRSNIQMVLEHLNDSELNPYLERIDLSDQEYLKITTNFGKCILINCDKGEKEWWFSRIPKKLPQGLVPSLLAYCNKDITNFINND